MLSQAAKYALRASIYLALNSDEKRRFSAKSLSEELGVPSPFLAKQLQQLSRFNLISSSKGPKGGFYMREENLRKSVLDVIKSIDGENSFGGCFLGKSECNESNPCAVHHIVRQFRNSLFDELGDSSMGDLARDIRGGKVISI